MKRDIPQAPDFPDDDRELDAQVVGSLLTLAILLVFCAGVAFGIVVSA